MMTGNNLNERDLLIRLLLVSRKMLQEDCSMETAMELAQCLEDCKDIED